MMQFSSLVWAVPLLLFAGVIISYTLNYNEKTTKLNISLAIVSFVLSILVMIERYYNKNLDYGYYIDWFVLDNFYYRIGYELNHTSAYFLVVVTGLNVVILLMNRQYVKHESNSTYGHINLICGLITAIVLSDNVLNYYILSFCTSVAVFLKLANLNVAGMIHTLRAFSKSFIIGHLLFLCALMLIFYYQPNHAVEFNVIDSSLSIQPDLLSMDEEWVIGLLLVLSTIFISTVIVPFEKQLRQQSLQHLVSLYTLTFVRILVPAYMLIRFESLIRIDSKIETIVILFGTILLLFTSVKMTKQLTIADILLNMSNAMLGMLYMMFGLQANLMLSALVLIYIVVYLLLLLLIVFNQNRVLFHIIKVCVSIILLLPFIMCISASNHYSLSMTMSVTYLNIITWVGIVTYSSTIFMCIIGLKRARFAEGLHLFKNSTFTYWSMLFIALLMIVTVSFSWINEFKTEERLQFAIEFNNQIKMNIIIICACIVVGFLCATMIKKTKYYVQSPFKNKVDLNWSILTQTKALCVKIIKNIDRVWNVLWEIKLPYVFKKVEVYISSLLPNIVTKIVVIWIIGLIISALLVMIRG